ncbi:MAG: GAF domain-containing protein [Bacteroidaceae bacterium]|nr:GAF domain-containing protein [Bacteroidaceae bacterium]
MTEKERNYLSLLPQLEALVSGQHHEVSTLANVSAALQQVFHWWWTGFYLVSGDKLLLGPFQGPPACYSIAYGRGVCGTAWQRGETLVVSDVETFPGHIACSTESKSEIVVPLFDAKGEVKAVLDIDSQHLNHFDETDKHYLEEAMRIVAQELYGE